MSSNFNLKSLLVVLVVLVLDSGAGRRGLVVIILMIGSASKYISGTY